MYIATKTHTHTKKTKLKQISTQKPVKPRSIIWMHEVYCGPVISHFNATENQNDTEARRVDFSTDVFPFLFVLFFKDFIY